MTLNDLLARFNPAYQSKMMDLQGRIHTQYMKNEADFIREGMRTETAYGVERMRGANAMDIEHIRANNSVELENIRARNSQNLEAYRNDREDTREKMRFILASQTEKLRARTAITTAQIGAQNNLDCIEVQHANTLEVMEKQLSQDMVRAGIQNTGVSFSSLIAQQEAKQKHLTDGISARANLRAKIFEMGMAFAMDEMKARANHKRELDKNEHASNLRREENYVAGLTAYIMKMLDNNEQNRAEKYIDELLAQWADDSEQLKR